jgi:hypothetical protein
MKKIICIAFLSLNLLVNAQGTLSLPEMCILYSGWNNKIVAAATGMERCEISVSGGTATKTSWIKYDESSDDVANIDGYFVVVSPGVKMVSITLTGIDKDSLRHRYGTFTYKVKPFPIAQISASTISKSTGLIANVSLGADSPFTGQTFRVTGGTIDGVPFSGVVIPGSIVEKVDTGKVVTIEVFYTRNGVKSEIPTQGTLRVVD